MTQSKHVKHMSLEQLEANRRNAKRSTGPKSRAGKLRAMFNAFKNGLWGAYILLPWESREKYLEHLNSYLLDYRPLTPREYRLVIRLAQNDWRLDRAAHYDKKAIENARSREELLMEQSRNLMNETRLERNSSHCLKQLAFSLQYDSLLEDRLESLGDIPILEVQLYSAQDFPPNAWGPTDLPVDKTQAMKEADTWEDERLATAPEEVHRNEEEQRAFLKSEQRKLALISKYLVPLLPEEKRGFVPAAKYLWSRGLDIPEILFDDSYPFDEEACEALMLEKLPQWFQKAQRLFSPPPPSNNSG